MAGSAIRRVPRPPGGSGLTKKSLENSIWVKYGFCENFKFSEKLTNDAGGGVSSDDAGGVYHPMMQGGGVSSDDAGGRIIR